MRILIMSCALALGGCAAMAEQQRAQEMAWETLTPEQQMVELERRRVAIEQQRANTEQIEAGLRMMQSAQPQFVPVQPSPFQAAPFQPLAPPKPVICNSSPSGFGSVQTVCN
jgi:hypothetical protein